MRTQALTYLVVALLVPIAVSSAVAQSALPRQSESILTKVSILDEAGQEEDLAAEMYYSVDRSATVFDSVEDGNAIQELSFQEPVYLLEGLGAWSRVRTQTGDVGFVTSRALSNIWVLVSKSEKTVYVYSGSELQYTFPADLAYNFFSDKKMRGGIVRPDHYRTPEGDYYVVSKNPVSQFYKAFVLNYPNVSDADAGLSQGIITEQQHRAITRAAETHMIPPMNTELGGWIEIHGNGTGARTQWTQGCVALTDADMDRLWRIIRVGTPVRIER